MLRRLRVLLGGLGESMRNDERAYGHYSRGFGVLVWVVVGLMVILAVVMAKQRPYAAAECRVDVAAATLPIEATSIELARTPGELQPLLAGKLALTQVGPQRELICVAERVERYAALLSMDGSLFIPAYLLLTAFALGWVLSMSVHATTEDGQWAPPRPGLAPLIGLSALAVVTTAWLDGAENRAALKVLEMAGGVGALLEPHASSLVEAVDASFAASLYKWFAAGVWAASLAALFWHQRKALAGACGHPSRWRTWVCRRLVQLFIALGTASALALMTGSIGGLLSDSTLAPWKHVAIVSGFVGVLLCALVLSLLELLRDRARRPMGQPCWIGIEAWTRCFPSLRER